jgi:hypothetical protein
MRWQASLGLRGAKVSGDAWVSQGSQARRAGGSARHILLTVPAMVRPTFDHNAAGGLRALIRCGAPGRDEVYRPVRGKALKGGASTGLHTPGRHGPSHPQLPLLAPSGGYAAQGARWEPLESLPDALFRRQGPWPLWRMGRATRQTEAIHPWVDRGCRQSPHGLVTNGPKGHVPSQSQSLARYVAKDGVSPPLAVRRIDRYDGERGPDHDRSHRPERLEHDTVTVETLIGRMVQQTGPKGCKRIRSDGVPATKTVATVTVAMHTALAQVEGVGQGAVQRIAR